MIELEIFLTGKYPPELLKDKVYKTLNDNTVDEGTDGPLDLADLDLSRLRLSKKDLETLSNIAPGLPKCFQDQLLAKLPPTQARKLSRTLSVQTNQNCSSVIINKRSQSSGRNASTSNESAYDRDEKETPSRSITTKSEKTFEFKKEIETSSEAAQHMTCTKINDDENAKGAGIVQNTNVNEKYKYYSPYVIKTVREMSQRNNINEGLNDLAPIGSVTMLGRPPSGRLSPPSSSDSAIRRPTQRRISRLIRTDLLEIPQEEIVEEPSKSLKPPDNETTVVDSYKPTLKISQHVRNKSLELFAECTTNNSKKDDSLKNNRRSLSRSRDVNDKVNADKHQLADKILQELQILSSMQSQREVRAELNDKTNLLTEKPILTTAKKVKKTKSKEKSTESSTDVDSKNTNTVNKKVKKIVKKSDPLISLKVQENQKELCETNNSVSVPETNSPKKMSKLKRPKSYPMKESILITQASDICNTSLTSAATNISSTNDDESNEHRSNESNVGVTELNTNSSVVPRESRLLRPKSYPSSKLTVQTESKKNDRNISNTTQIVGESPLINSTKKVTKGLKKSKLSQLSNTSASIQTPNTISTNGDDIKELSPISNNIKTKEKAVEKRTNKGLLYAIGQKFEKFRASASSNSCANIPIQKQSSADNTKSKKVINKISEVKKTKSLGCNSYAASNTSDNINNCQENKNETICIAPKPLKSEKRSRIDAMIRNLREKSVPRSQPSIPSESNYIKRAVSVEEMPGTFNKKSVNKMLGLFKRADKGSSSENRVRTTRSTSNIERHVSDTSPIYQNTDIIVKLNNKIEKNNAEVVGDELASSNKPIKTCKNEGYCKCETLLPTVTLGHPTIINPNCPECCIELSEEKNDLSISNIKNYKEGGNQEKRKGLMLELLRLEKGQNPSSTYGNICSGKKYPTYNDNEIYSNISQYSRSIPSSSGNGSNILTMENSSNNNISSMINSNTNSNNNNSNNNHSSSLHTSQTSGYRTSSTHEMNQNNNLLSPSFENIGNYSSDSRSYQEDCASTSTFLSPTEEAELCFDTWSVCSEDNYRRQHTTPSPTVSRLSRASQASSPTRRGGDSSETSESVVDRIKRRSFYCRFNEKRPKRTSSIVGPNAVREYYREKSSTTKTRSSTKIASTEREHSPDITQEFFRPLKLSPIGTELKPPIYRSSFSTTHTDYSSAAGRPRKSLSDIRAPPSPSCLSERRHGSFVNTDKDLLTNSPLFSSRYKINAYEDVPRSKFAPTDAYYNTYNPKRRFSFTTNANASNTNGGISSTNSSHIDGYATMGRRPIRAYDHRTMSLLDPPNYSTPTYRHEATTATATPSTVRDFTTSLSR